MTGWQVTRDPWWLAMAAAWTLAMALMIASAVTVGWFR